LGHGRTSGAREAAPPFASAIAGPPVDGGGVGAAVGTGVAVGTAVGEGAGVGEAALAGATRMPYASFCVPVPAVVSVVATLTAVFVSVVSVLLCSISDAYK